MSIRTSRASGNAEVMIDPALCTACGVCVEVCKGGPLYLEEHVLKVNQAEGFGCIACGACITVCPADAIRISGRDLFPEDVLPLPPTAERAGYQTLQNLLLARRSTRLFNSDPVDPDLVSQILEAAAAAPMGYPPTDVSVLVLANREAVSRARRVLLNDMKSWKYIFSPFMIALMRPFIGKENADMYGKFLMPAMNMMLEKDAAGEDWFLYNAPLAIYFYGTAYSDPADPVIAATYAMLAGESLGLGTCMLGFPGYIFQYSPKARKTYHLPKKIQPGLMVLFGHPKFKRQHALRRRFAQVSILEK